MEKVEMKLPLCSAAEGEKRLRHPEKDCEVWMDSEKDAQSRGPIYCGAFSAFEMTP